MELVLLSCFAASYKVYQLLAQRQWFSPGTSASTTTKTGCHDMAEILLKVTLNTKNLKSIQREFISSRTIQHQISL
jgi:hypothetical protein